MEHSTQDFPSASQNRTLQTNSEERYQDFGENRFSQGLPVDKQE